MRAAAWIVLMASLLVLAGCSGDDPVKKKDPVIVLPPNDPPETVLSNAPPEGSTTSFQVHMNWYGTDPDGKVDGYFFSWDDTASWFFTPSTESTFVVSADQCVQCDWSDTLYFAVHTFWIKAVDDRGAHDPTPAHRTFTAESTAPITTITRGPCERGYCGLVGTNLLFEWTSFDPDGGEIDSFYYRQNLTGGLHETANSEWIRVGSDCTYVRFIDVEPVDPATGMFNSFAVVARDNAGAVERVLVHGQNFCCFEIYGGCLGLTIDGGALGTRNTAAAGGPEHMSYVSEISEGVGVSFEWEAEAGMGEAAAGYRYALDDTLAWSGWDHAVTRYPEDGGTFLPAAGSHVFFVDAVSDMGTRALCYLKFNVVP